MGSMPGGHAAPDRPRPLRVLGAVIATGLAIGATAGLIVTDDARWLRVAVLAAAWTCAIGLMAGGRRHNGDGLSAEREADLRRMYELELEHEVAARREYELGLEVTLRREIEAGLRADVGGLRSELAALRRELAEHRNGEMRWERFALQAQGTRLTGPDRQLLEREARWVGMDEPRQAFPGLPFEPPSGPLPRITDHPGAAPGAQDPASWRPQPPPPARMPVLDMAAAKPVDDPLFGPLPADAFADRFPGRRHDRDGSYQPVPERRRRYRDDGEDNEVLTRIRGGGRI